MSNRAAARVKAVVQRYTVRLWLKYFPNRASRIRTMARGYRNIRTGTHQETMDESPKLAIPKETALKSTAQTV